MNIAVITGASSGLGKEFAIQIDRMISNIDEIWLIARRKDRLEELSRRLLTKTKIISFDVTDDGQMDILEDLLQQEDPTIRMLINCAGYGMLGYFVRSNLSEQVGMIDVNCAALTKMTYLCLPFMRKNSRIINLASSAAFLPQPNFAVYAATKSYVLSFSRALSEELRQKRVYVTAVCPGPVETEFFDIAERNGSNLAVKKILMVQVQDVVKDALLSSMRRKPTAVYGLPIRIVQLASKLLPHGLILRILRMLK